MEEGCGGEGRKRKEGRQPEEKEGVAEKARTAGDGPSTASVSGDGPSTASVSGEEVSSQHGHVTSAAEDREVPDISIASPPCLAPTALPTSAVPSTSQTAPVARGPGASEFPGQLSMQGGQGNIGSVQNSGSIGHLGHNFYNDNDKLQSIAARTIKNLEKACPQGYVKTSSYYRALGKVRRQGCCMITGTSGSGKTTLARHLLLAFRDKGYLPLELITPDECQCVPWQKVGDDKLRLVLLVDNVAGAGNFEDDLRRKWEIQLKPMKPFIECRNVLVILASRANFYAAIKGKEEFDQVLYEAPEVSLGGEDCQLSSQEKLEILRSTLVYNKAKLPDQMSMFFAINASESLTKIGFPQLCVYLAKNPSALRNPVTFFQNPMQFLGGEFQNMKKDDKLSYFVLILVLLQEGQLSEKFVKDKENKKFFKEVADLVGLSRYPGCGLILDRAKQLCESYLEYDSQSKRFSFTHQSVWDVLFSDMCHSDFEKAASVCTFKQLVMYVRTDPKSEKSEEFVYVVPSSDWHILIERLLQELTSGDADLACSHPCLQHPDFVQELLTDMNISTLLKTQHKKKTVSFKYEKLNSMEGSATSAFPISLEVTAFIFQSCISYLLLRRCSSAAKHILQSAQFQVLSPFTQSQLLTEALACALYVSDPDMVDWLLDRGAVPSQECVRAACCAEQENVGLVERALQRDSVLSAELLTEMARVAWQKDRPRTLELVLSRLTKFASTQAELDRILAEMILFTYPNKPYQSDLMLLCRYGIKDLSHMLSILKKAGAQFRTHIDPHTAAGHTDPSALSEWLEHKVDLGVRDKHGYTLLHHAAETGALSNVQALLEVMESTGQLAQLVNVQTGMGDTALHLAAWNGRLAVIEALLKKDADASMFECRNKTALSILASCQRWKMEGYMSPSEDQMAASSSSHSSGFQSQAHVVNVMRVKDLLRMLVTNTISFEDSFSGNPQRMAFCEDQTLLNKASSSGYCLLVEVLVERKVDVNVRDGRGRTPVHCAAQRGHVDVLEVLSKNEAQLDVRDSRGQTALHVAAREGHLPVVEMLIQNKVNINIADKRERTPLHEAALLGHDQVVKCLLDNGATVNAADKDGKQPLHLAAGGGHFSAVKCLVEGGASVNAKGRDGRTCLLVASAAGDVSTLELLFAHGADVAAVDNSGNNMLHLLADRTRSLYRWKSQTDTARMASLVKSLGGLVNCQTKQGDTPVMLAVKNKNYDVLRELLRLQPDLSISNDAGDTALHLAAAPKPWWIEKGPVKEPVEECMSILAEKCVEVLNNKNRIGDVPLLLAARAGSLICLKEILQYPVDVSVKSKGGNTSLHELVCGVYASFIRTHESLNEIVEKLVRKCPDLINSTNDEGDTPVLTAVRYGQWFLLSLFLKHSVDFSVKCKGGNSVLHELACRLNEWEIERDESGRKTVESIVEGCAHLINCPNDEGDTPVLTAARKGHWFLLSLFLKQQCDVRARDRRGNTLLHCLAESNPSEEDQITVQVIIADLADLVDRANEEGDTAVIVAARIGNELMVRELVALQCNVRLRNKRGETALFLAIKNEHRSAVDMVEMLLEQDVLVNSQTEEYSLLLYTGTGIGFLERKCWEGEAWRKAVQTFLEKCKFLASCPNSRGETPLYLAFLHGNLCVADLLLEQAGSSVDCREGGLTDKPQEAAGRTPLHALAASCVLLHKLKYDASLRERVSVWVKRFSHWVNHPDPEGNTPILLALRQENLCVAEQLIQCGADLSVTDAEGNTPIMLALRNGRLSVAEQLIQCGADLSVTDAEGNTVLHVLTEKTVTARYYDTVKDTKANESVVVKVTELAKAAGVTPLTPNKEGETALYILRQMQEEIRKAVGDDFKWKSDKIRKELETRIHWYRFLRDLWLSEEK